MISHIKEYQILSEENFLIKNETQLHLSISSHSQQVLN
jgi:hypothetical protein